MLDWCLPNPLLCAAPPVEPGTLSLICSFFLQMVLGPLIVIIIAGLIVRYNRFLRVRVWAWRIWICHFKFRFFRRHFSRRNARLICLEEYVDELKLTHNKLARFAKKLGTNKCEILVRIFTKQLPSDWPLWFDEAENLIALNATPLGRYILHFREFVTGRGDFTNVRVDVKRFIVIDGAGAPNNLGMKRLKQLKKDLAASWYGAYKKFLHGDNDDNAYCLLYERPWPEWLSDSAFFGIRMKDDAGNKDDWLWALTTSYNPGEDVLIYRYHFLPKPGPTPLDLPEGVGSLRDLPTSAVLDDRCKRLSDAGREWRIEQERDDLAAARHAVAQSFAASAAEWNDWRWQIRNSMRSTSDLNNALSSFCSNHVDLTLEAEQLVHDLFPLNVTPHTLSALCQALEADVPGAWEAFRGCFVPTVAEIDRHEERNGGRDCIGEELPTASPAPSITRFYNNRVLFKVTTMCPAHCRFCFRRRMVGNTKVWDDTAIEDGLRHIATNRTIREVILSGGDPLLLSDAKIEMLLERLSLIPHVRRIRFDTNVLSTIPQRITPELIGLLKGLVPTHIVAHFCHSYEMAEGTREACEALANAGIPLASHTPLLKGINDDVTSLADLFELLVDCRIRPYYLIQFIPTPWSEHFRVPISRALEIVRDLARTCSGLAMPSYVVYLPDAGGKVPVLPQYLKEKSQDGWVFKNLEGREITYPEPSEPGVEL